MNTDQRLDLKEIYEAMVDCEPAQRPSLLAQLCAGEPALRAEIEALLELLPQADHFIEEPPALAVALLNEMTRTLVAGRRVGPYEVLDELGRGGMGVVYLAFRADDAYRKEVAIKLVWPSFDIIAITRRFYQERQILANLDHPHITRLLDGGTTEEGWPYVVMEYVDGQPIHNFCNDQQMSVDERLALFQQVCAAVEYAHQHFVVHRDLKPSNILVTKTGQIKLLDFGIAKILDPALLPNASTLTHTGLHALTPEYASPEQVRGDEITTASDVYSLGVVLYELLTGQPIYRFKNRAMHEVLRVIAEAEPVRPSQICSGGSLPLEGQDPVEAVQPNQYANAHEYTPDKLRRRLAGDLDKIILKALRKEPAQRYATVIELSADLARHLAGEPVKARPATLGYRAGKFIRRHPTSFAIAVTLLMAMLAVFVYTIKEAREQRRLAYAARMHQASADWYDDNPRSYDEILQTPPVQPRWGESDLRGLEWRYLWQLGHRERLSVGNIDVADVWPWNKREALLFSYKEHPLTFSLINPRSGQTVFEQRLEQQVLAYRQSFLNAAGQPGMLYQADGQTLQNDHFFSGAPYQPVTELNSATCMMNMQTENENTLLTGHPNGHVMRWDFQTKKYLETLFTAVGPVSSVFPFPQFGRVVTIADHDVLQLWDMRDKRELLRLNGVTAFASEWGAQHPWLVLELGKGRSAVYEMYSGRILSTLDSSQNPTVTFSTFNSQARQWLVLSRQDNSVKIYDMPALRLLATFSGHEAWVNSHNLSSDGKWLATASSDRTIKIWDVETQRALTTLRGHQEDVMSVAWIDHDRQLISVSKDHKLKIWDVPDILRPEKLTGHKGHVFSVALSADGRTLASASQDRTIKLWDTATGALLKTLEGHYGQVFCVNFSPDGQRLVSSGEGQIARVWEVATGKMLYELCCHLYQMHSAVFSPDGKFIATASDDRVIKLWDASNGCELRSFNGTQRDIWSLGFAPDGRTLAAGTDQGEVRLWDVATGSVRAAFKAHDRSSVWSIAFAPDGQSFATASGDNTARLWRTDTQTLIREFKGHADGLFSLVFSPDGQRLATASEDKTVRIWNVATGQELLAFKGHTDQVWSVAMSSDGNTLASGSWDGTIRLWHAATDQQIQGQMRR